MRCPKCHYLSFDPEPRCRNCGYGFSLDESDLPLRGPAEPAGPLADLNLKAPGPDDSRSDDSPLARPAAPAFAAVAIERAGSRAVPSMPAAAARVSPRPHGAGRLLGTPPSELPLFVKGLARASADESTTPTPDPPVTVPAAPRPLGVRRRVADASVTRPRPPRTIQLGPLDRDLLEDLQRIEKVERKDTQASASRVSASPSDYPAGAGHRLAAAGLDVLLLAVLTAGVVWLTMRWTDLSLDRLLTVSVMLPTLAFLVVLVEGYLLMFTAAGGQTIGKMALGLRVVGEDERGAGQPLTARRAAYRVLLMLPSVLVFGAGFVPALVGDERALHDRLAHTRVVRA
jgi:uncharacterized RDD family membrane protein YckC